jgi:hypothetical protein
VDFIKVYNWLSSGGLTQVVALANKHGIPVIGHTPLSWTSVGSIDAGMQGLEHLRLRPYEVLDDLELVAEYPVDGSLMKRTGFWAHVTPTGTALAKTLDAWEERRDRFFVTPTLVVQEAVAESYDYPSPEFLTKQDTTWLSSGMLARWRAASPPRHWGDLDAEEIAEAKASVNGMATFVRLAHERGIRILAGTDSPVPWLVPGASLHRELRHFVELCGMTPVEAIHTATGRAASALESRERGIIAEGRIADMVILNGDLARDIGALDRVERIILAGHVLVREQLLEEARRWAEEDVPPGRAP